MTSNDTNNSGRVTTREFYDALLDQNKERADMERRLGDKLDGITSSIAANDEKFKAQDKRIDENSGEIKKTRNLNAGIALLASTIAGILGVNK